MIDVPARPISPCWEARTEDGEVARGDGGALERFGIALRVPAGSRARGG